MKRLGLLLALLLATVPLFATTADREVLLTADGTLYTIDSEFVTDDMNLQTSSSSVLRLTVQKGDSEETIFVPASLSGGIHSTPSLAYDAATQRLFVFWQKMPNLMSSELLFCSYKDGQWSDATSIDNAPYHFRFNLRIAATRVVSNTSDDGTVSPEQMLVVHAVWWDQTGYGESARYAMLGINDGTVSSIHIHDLLEFAAGQQSSIAAALPDGFNRDFFRHPAIFEAPTHDSISVVFGDWDTNRIERVKVIPIAENGVLHLPVGAWSGELEPPHRTEIASADAIYTVSSTASDALAFYYHNDKGLSYVLYRNGEWTDENTIVLNPRVSEETGIDAIKRLVQAQ